MSRLPSSLPPSLQYDVFTAAEARREGVSTDRLRSSDLRRLGYGIYARSSIDPTEIAIITALTRSDPLAVARGASAARYWGLPLPQRTQTWSVESRTSPIQMTAGGYVRRNTRLVHWNRQRIRATETATFGALRVTVRARTWIDLAQELRLDQLVEIGDHLVREPRRGLEHRVHPYSTPAQLSAAVNDHPGRGRPLLRQALELIRVGSDSPAETRLRLAAARAGLPEPVLNVRQFDESRDLGEPDLAWPTWRVCVEHDGPTHRTPEQQEKDITRRERREAAGWIEVQTVAADLRQGCRNGIRRLEEALARHGWRRGRAA